MQGFMGDTCPLTVGDKMIPTEYEGVDADVFNECLKSWQFRCPVGFLSEKVQRTSVRRQCVGALQMGADVSDGIVPDGIR